MYLTKSQYGQTKNLNKDLRANTVGHQLLKDRNLAFKTILKETSLVNRMKIFRVNNLDLTVARINSFHSDS